jgi:ribosomal protein S15P/S13E
MSNWLYKNKEINTIEDFPKETFGFIYKVTYIPENITYIGKKSLYHNTNKKLGKKELEALPTTRGRKPTTKLVTKESDWKSYYGSAKPILELLKEKKHDKFNREILQFVNSKKLLTYYECKYLFEYGVLEYPSSYFNDNILGKFFTKDFAPQD